MSVDQNEIRFVQLYSPISNQKIPVDFTCKCRNKDPVVAAFNVVVISDNDVLASINRVSASSNHVVVLAEAIAQLF